MRLPFIRISAAVAASACALGFALLGSQTRLAAAASPMPASPMPASIAPASTAPADCAPGNGGLTLPPGFCATVYADHLGHARHLTAGSDGTV